MKLKYLIVVIFILIATVISVGTIVLSVNTKYKQVEYEEIQEIKKVKTPKLYIEGDLSMKDKTEIGKFKIKYESENINLDKYATLKIQGSTSAGYEKKNYTIKFYEDKECLDKYKVNFGWGRENKYVLKANWVDKTHSRNIVMAHIAAKVQDKYNLFTSAPNNGLIDGFPVEVYLNNEFYGLYTLNIPKDEWLYGMDKNNPNHIVMVGEKTSESTLFKEVDISDWNNQLDDNSEETQNKFLRLMDFVINSTDEEFKENFEQYLNLDSVLNYYVLCHTFNISDNRAKNLVFATYDGKVWYPTLYDLDTTFGAHYNGLALYPIDNEVTTDYNTLFERFRKLYSKEIYERYIELRKTIFTEENIIKEIDSFYSKFDPISFKKEQERWENIPGYDINQMKDYMHNRLPHIDKFMQINYPYINEKINV